MEKQTNTVNMYDSKSDMIRKWTALASETDPWVIEYMKKKGWFDRIMDDLWEEELKKGNN